MMALIYTSRAKREMRASDLDELAESARLHNVQVGVTGMLLYSHRRFLQHIEGDDDDVEEVFARIAADPRHSDIRVHTRHPVEARLFPDWSMGFDAPDPWLVDAWLARVIKPEPTYKDHAASIFFDPEISSALLCVYAPNG